MDAKSATQLIKSSIALVDAMAMADIEFTSTTGDAWKARCFLHEEQVPSLTISPKKGLFHCFSTGCNASGDVVSFYQQRYRLSFGEAIKKLADDFGLEIGLDGGSGQAQGRLLMLMGKMTDAFHDALMRGSQGAVARTYAKRRGVKDDTLRAFKVGYSPSVEFATGVAKRAGATDTELRLLGCGRRIAYQSKLIFPVSHPSGRWQVHHSGDFQRKDKDAPKYVGPAGDNPLQWEGAVFGLDVARKNANPKDRLVLVEGFFDALVLHSSGIKSVASALGSSPSAQQVGVLREHNFLNITVVFDQDKAGIAGVKKLVKSGTHGLSVRVGSLPSGDPDEYVLKHGIEGFQALMDQATTLGDFLIGSLAKLLAGGLGHKVEAVRELHGILTHLPAYESGLAYAELASILGVPAEDLRDAGVQADAPDTAASELALLAASVQEPSSLIEVKNAVGAREVWSTSKHRQLWLAIVEQHNKGVHEFTPDLLGRALPDGTEIPPLWDTPFGSVPYHLGVVKDAYMRRTLANSAKRLISATYDGHRDVVTVASEHLADIAGKLVTTEKREFTAPEQVEMLMSYIQERIGNNGTMPGIELGNRWKKLTDLLLGWQPSYHYMISALPKVGKTNLMLNFAKETIIERKVPGAIISLEMRERDLGLRLLSIMTGISNTRMKMGAVTEQEQATIEQAAVRYHEAPLHLVNAAGMTISEITSLMRKLRYVNGVEHFYLDYIQLIENPGKKEFHVAHTEVSRSLKNTISQLNVPLISMSQLGRAGIEGGGSAYIAGGMSYSRDCDFSAILKRRTEEDLMEDPVGNLTLDIDMNRHGESGSFIRLDFTPENLQIEEAAT